MANVIITKNSSTASNVPAVGELVEGELAINTADKILYCKTASAVFQVFDGVYATAAHVHDTFDRASSVLSGATVFSNIVVTDGITTAIATREFGAADLATGSLASGVNQYFTASTGNFSYKIPFMNYTGTASTNASMLHESTATFTYNPSTNTLAVSNINQADGILDRSRIKDYSIESDSKTVSANAVTLTYTNGPAFEVDLEAATGAVTITISGGPPTGTYGEIIVKVQQDTTAARTITWAGGTFEWPGGTAPTMTATADAIDIYHFSTWNGGTTWWGSAIQDCK